MLRYKNKQQKSNRLRNTLLGVGGLAALGGSALLLKRRLNVKGHTRMINGKVVTVNPYNSNRGVANTPIEKLKNLNNKPVKSNKSYASLGIVVPADTITRLKIDKKSMLNNDELIDVIGDAVYFRADTPEIMDKIERKLKSTSEPIVGGRKEVYLRLDIPNAQDIIGKTNLYPLQRDLPKKEKGTVSKYFMLHNFDGIENFNRI